jgi:DNA-binding PadR family transcriptional regulator
MFPDHSLMPKEALRLAALGMLAERPMSYGELARSVRDFVDRIMGPSPEAMGSSLELLRVEGLIGQQPGGDATAPLSLTAKGRAEFVTLMLATVRTPFNDLNKLVVALKLRFLPLLPAEGRRDQTTLLIESCRVELARLLDLRSREAGHEGGPFLDWLDHDIAQAQARLAWFESLAARL